MSALTAAELDRFHEFARRQLQQGAAGLTLDDLVGLWQVAEESPSDDEFAESVTAVQAALADLRNGERGITAEEHLRQLREKYQLAEHANDL